MVLDKQFTRLLEFIKLIREIFYFTIYQNYYFVCLWHWIFHDKINWQTYSNITNIKHLLEMWVFIEFQGVEVHGPNHFKWGCCKKKKCDFAKCLFVPQNVYIFYQSGACSDIQNVWQGSQFIWHLQNLMEDRNRTKLMKIQYKISHSVTSDISQILIYMSNHDNQILSIFNTLSDIPSTVNHKAIHHIRSFMFLQTFNFNFFLKMSVRDAN